MLFQSSKNFVCASALRGTSTSSEKILLTSVHSDSARWTGGHACNS